MDRIRELLARLNSEDNPLSDEERAELRQLISDEYARLDALDPTPGVVAEMAEIVEANESLVADDQRVAQELADAEAEREALRERMRAANEPTAEGEGEGEGDAAGGDDDAETTEGDDDVETETQTTPSGGARGTETPARAAATARGRVGLSAVRTARTQVAPLADRSPERLIPDRTGEQLQTALVAAADVHGFGIGQELPTWDDVGAAFNARLGAIQRAQGGRRGNRRRGGADLVLVASAKWDYPEDRLLSEGNDADNRRKLEAVVGREALVASGGTCAPVAVDYDVPVWSVAVRPLRDSLAQYGATRGGLTFTPPPTISGLAGATTIWTEANDASPSSPATKPVLRINCGSPTTVYVDAIPTRVEVGNFMGRFAPEWTGANLQLAVAAAARIAETNILTKMLAASTVVTSGKLLGATRDVLALLDQALMAYRYEQRIPETVRLHAWFPDWFRNMVRADIARELAHDIDDTDPFAIDDATINAWFSARGVNVTFFIDYLAAVSNANGSGVNIPNQYPGSFSSGAALPEWPSNGGNAGMLWFLAAEGTFQFLDGGELDLGIVRDTVLDATNDYETFVETFEGVAFRGIRSLAVVSYVRPSGASAAGISTASY